MLIESPDRKDGRDVRKEIINEAMEQNNDVTKQLNQQTQKFEIV